MSFKQSLLFLTFYLGGKFSVLLKLFSTVFAIVYPVNWNGVFVMVYTRLLLRFHTLSIPLPWL